MGRGSVRRRVWLGGLMAALVLATAGCDGGGDEAGESTTTAEQTTTTAAPTTEAPTTTLSPEEQVLAAYRAAIEAFVAASNPPNPDHPLLAERMTGQQVEFARSGLSQLRALNTGHVLTPELHPRDVVISGETATLTDCLVDHTQVIDLGTGAPIGAPGETVLHVNIGMERIGGTWKLATQERRTDPCDPSAA